MQKDKNKIKYYSKSDKKNVSIELISSTTCGVDIDFLRLEIPNSFRRYLFKYEKKIVEKNKFFFSYIWTAREAIFKCMQNPNKTDFFTKIKIIDLDLKNRKGIGMFSNQKFILNYIVFKDKYLICFVNK